MVKVETTPNVSSIWSVRVYLFKFESLSGLLQRSLQLLHLVGLRVNPRPVLDHGAVLLLVQQNIDQVLQLLVVEVGLADCGHQVMGLEGVRSGHQLTSILFAFTVKFHCKKVRFYKQNQGLWDQETRD